MFLKQFGSVLVLGLNFGLKLFDLLLPGVVLSLRVGGVSFASEAARSVFKELLLPSVVLGGVNFVFVARIRDGYTFNEVLPDNRNFRFRR